MTIKIVYPDGCPNWRLTHQLVPKALTAAGHVDAEVHLRLSAPRPRPQAGMHGSPTILVDDADPFPSSDGAAWSCRLYRNAVGFEGAPSMSALVEVLH